MGHVVNYSHIQDQLEGDSLGHGSESAGVYPFKSDSDFEHCVYKQYKSGTGDDNRFNCIYDLIDFISGLDRAARKRFGKYCAPPIKLVVDDDNRLSGVIMPRFGKSYKCRTSQTHDLDAKLDMYLCSDSKVQNAYGLRPLSDQDRYTIVIRSVLFIHYLHTHGFVYGDISFNNILIHFDTHTPLFIDGDGMSSIARGVGFMKQAHTAGFIPPEGHVPCAVQTDVYKIAKLIICLFDQTEQPRQANFGSPSAQQRITSLFDRNAWDVIKMAGHETPSQRPSARELFVALNKG